MGEGNRQEEWVGAVEAVASPVMEEGVGTVRVGR